MTDTPRALLCASALLCCLTVSCAKESTPGLESDQGRVLIGTWNLSSKLIDGIEAPIKERFMKLSLRDDSTFTAQYRGLPSQKWISAGEGAFTFQPPYLRFYWESGQVVTLTVVERDKNRLRAHHGLNLAPLANQAPDEVFIREKSESGASQGSS